jgi:hypothetical protein
MTTTLTSLLTDAAVTQAPKRATQWAEFVALLDRRHDLRDSDRDTLRRLMAELDLSPRDVELAVQARDQHDAILAKGGIENVKARAADLKHALDEKRAYLLGKRGEKVQGMLDRLVQAITLAQGALDLAKTADERAAEFRMDPAIARYWGTGS